MRPIPGKKTKLRAVADWIKFLRDNLFKYFILSCPVLGVVKKITTEDPECFSVYSVVSFFIKNELQLISIVIFSGGKIKKISYNYGYTGSSIMTLM